MTGEQRGRIAVGASGTGSNLRALVEASRRGSLPADVVLVFADRDCPALDWAVEQGIDTALVPRARRDDAAGRAAEDAALAVTLGAVAPDLVVLAGYMRVLGPATLLALRDRIVNTHPSLLPAFAGAHPVRDALAAGVHLTGATVHLVDETLDGGRILAQEPVRVLPGDDQTALHERIKSVEHRLLPATVARLLAGIPRADALARLAAVGVPAAPCLGFEELFSDPFLRASGCIAEQEHAGLGRVLLGGPMIRFSATPIVYRRAAPLLGADGAEVLKELGYPAERIATLVESGVVGRGG